MWQTEALWLCEKLSREVAFAHADCKALTAKGLLENHHLYCKAVLILAYLPVRWPFWWHLRCDLFICWSSLMLVTTKNTLKWPAAG